MEFWTVAVVAHYYQRPVYEFLDYLAGVREQYGDAAALWEVEHGLALREEQTLRDNEIAERQAGDNDGDL